MKTVFVIGATGQQGGSVARFLSQTGKYIVVCGTRNPTSDAASQLATLANSKVVTCNLDDVKNLVECFTGCDYVFAVTNFWGLLQDPRGLDKYNLQDHMKLNSPMGATSFPLPRMPRSLT